MSKEHLPVNDEVLMAHLEEQARRDLVGLENNLEEEEWGYPDWSGLRSKLKALKKLERREDTYRAT